MNIRTARLRPPLAGIGTHLDQAFGDIDAALARPAVWTAAVATLIALQSWLILTHSAWLDEWQALLIAVQSPGIAALLDNLRYEGHPPLWYLLLDAGAAIFPFQMTLAAVQLVIALTIQCLILLRSPFSRTERLMIAASYFVLFEFGTLSRSLGLGVLILIAFFATRSRHLAWGLVALMPMVDLPFGLLSIVAIALLIRDRRWSTGGAIVWAVSSLLAAWSVLPAPDMIPHRPELVAGVLKLLTDFSALLVPIQTTNGQIGWGGGLPWGMGLIAGPIFLIFALNQMEADPLHKWLFRAFLVTMCGLSLCIYPLSIRHLALIAMLLILLKGREVADGRPADRMFRGWLAVIALGGLAVAAISATRPFDSAPRAAAYIRAHGLHNSNWVSWPQGRGVGVGAILGREMAMLRKDCTHSFIRWNFRDGIETESDLRDSLAGMTRKYGRSYLLTGIDLSSVSAGLLKPLTAIPAGYDGHPYFLYVISPELPETGRRPPPCPPVREPIPR